MRLCVLSALTLLAVSFFVQPAIAQNTAALDRFVGTWKEDESKRDIAGSPPLVFRQGKNIEELRGGEVSPTVQQVVFDGKPQDIGDGAFIAWRQLNANTYERRLTENGKLVTTRTLTIAPDGKTLTEKTDQTRADGKPRSTTMVYQRIEGEKGLVGRWKPQSVKTTLPAERYITKTGPNAMKHMNALGRSFTASVDGKPVPEEGPAVIPGSMAALRLTGERTLEVTFSRDGKEIGRTELALSADGRTLTETSRSAGPNRAASVFVFTKQ